MCLEDALKEGNPDLRGHTLPRRLGGRVESEAPRQCGEVITAREEDESCS